MHSVSSANNPAKRFLTLIIVGAITLLTASSVVGQNSGDIPDRDGPGVNEPVRQWVDGQLVVKFTDGVDVSEIMASMFNYNLVRVMEHSRTYLFTADKTFSPSLTTQSLSGITGVEWAHPNYVLNRLHAVQGSYPFGDLLKVGSMDDQPAVDLLDLPASQQVATGSGITVAVIDGGIDIYHPGLDEAALFGHDFVDNNETPFDVPDGFISGHGTFVAGLVHLTAPGAQIKAYRVIDENGFGDGFSLALAIERAVDDGCRVINISLVLMHQHLAVAEALEYANSMGVTVITAAGNDASSEPIYPAADEYTIGVTAIDSLLTISDFSNFGSQIDVCAPGTWAYSTYQHQEYAWWSGTSFAAPFVSGQVALLLEQSPLASPAEVRNAISASSSSLDTSNPEYSGQLGSGLISPLTALSIMGESATLTPDTLYYTHWEGVVNIVAPGAGTIIASTNAPAMWTTEILGESLPFSIWIDSVGYTNDSLWITIDPYSTPEGEYSATVRFAVVGISQPVDLTIKLTVLPNEGVEDYALLNPNTLFFEADLGSDVIMTGSAVLWSTNAPASYNAEVVGGSFTTLIDATGMTNDSVRVSINPSLPLSAGLHIDTVIYQVDGIENPAVMYVNLQINDPNLPTDTGWVWPQVQTHTTSPDLDHVLSGMIFVGSSGGSYEYSFSVLDNNDVVVLAVPFEPLLTNDSLIFEIQSGYGRPAGLYADTLIFTIDGITNSPLMAVVNLVVDTAAGGGTASAWPYSQYIEVEELTPFDLTGAVLLDYTGGVTAYTASVVGGDYFVELDQTSGITGDSVWFSVSDTVGLDSGIYIDTIRFEVEAASNSPVSAIVYLAVGGAGSGKGVATVRPLAQAFYGPANELFSRNGNMYLTVTKEPHDFTVSVSGVNDFTTLIDTTGISDDSIRFVVGSDTGLVPGVYIDSIQIDVPNASNTPIYALLLLEIADSTGGGVDTCCTMAGDLNGNGVDMEWADTVPLSLALSTGDIGYIDCLAAADVNHDCVIDNNDLSLLTLLILGDSLPYPDCGICPGYTFVPDTTTGGGGGGDSAWVSPTKLMFNVPYQSLGMYSDWVNVFSSNAPANYVAWVLDGPLSDPNSFVTIPDSVGTTNDSILISVSADGLELGSYVDTVVFDVSGIDNSELCIVTINIAADSSSSHIVDGADLQNFPNPFNPVTTISFSLAEPTTAELSIYNVLGQRVITLINGPLSAGPYQIDWYGTNEQGQKVASGVYLYRLKAGDISITKKMLMLK